mmetsp:Transcript_23754/g.16816  ORF Transcript_23754/g.16816 Transcript_23754/m.16816 type:complete len:118 (-) Transcript_23754:134-487(-)
MDELINKPWANLGKYSLMAIVCHKNSDNLEHGHYVSFVKRMKKIPYEDKSLKEISEIDEHRESGHSSGHSEYQSLNNDRATLTGKEQWYYCNDESIQIVKNTDHILKQTKSAYILIY